MPWKKISVTLSTYSLVPKTLSEAREMAQLASVCNCSSRGFDALLPPLKAPAHTQCTDIHAGKKIQTCKIKMKQNSAWHREVCGHNYLLNKLSLCG